MIPEVGQRFGPYEILGRLGGGGMGLVFRAWDARLHREVAVKLLHNEYKMPAMRERFLLEARAASSLSHPNICTIFDIGDQDGNPYLVMELLQGESLRNRIARGALPVEEIVRYAQEVADALAAASVKGIVHRDIKPANIFLVNLPSGKSQAKVLDFGLARIGLSAGGGWGSRTLDLALAGGTVGTLAYMSPEQGRGESLDVRSDLFSLGIVMYEMATCQVPFKGTTSAQVFQQLFNRTPDPVRNWNTLVPRHLEKIILKLLVKDRRERYQTAKELHDALGKIVIRKGLRTLLNKAPLPSAAAARGSGPHTPRPSAQELAGLERMFDDVRMTRTPSPLPGGPSGASVPGKPAAPRQTPLRDRVSFLARAVRQKGHSSAVAERDSSTGKFAAARALADQAEERNRLAHVALESSSGHAAADAGYGLGDLDSGRPLDARAVEGPALTGPPAKRLRERRMRKAAEIAVALTVLYTGIYLLARGGHFRPVVLGPQDGLLLTVIQNRTGDKALDGDTVMQGLGLELRQADKLKVLGAGAYHAGLRQIGYENNASAPAPVDRVAQVVGAKDYIYGEVTRSRSSYTISVEVLDTASNDKVVSLEQTAKGREQIPEAISKLAQQVRAEVAAGGWRRAQQPVSLEQEATGNVDALHEYALAESALRTGRGRDALAAYQQAVSLDPRFIEAQMQLAWLARSQGAELDAANAARMAQSAAVHASERVRLLAQFCYLINVNADYAQAQRVIRRYVTLNPHDAGGLAQLALVSRLQGYLPEGLLAAQQSYGEDASATGAYEEAERALIGVDRYDAALQLEAQGQHKSAASGANTLAAAYLGGKQDVLAKQIDVVRVSSGKVSSAAQASAMQALNSRLVAYALYLDNTGQFEAGENAWRAAARSVPTLHSAGASMLARAALDRALTENCESALRLATEVSGMERGPVAMFNAGMAAALCGDKPYADKTIADLQQKYPENVAVQRYEAAELEAAADIGINEPEQALHVLLGIGEYDQITLAPYLRGLAHAAVHQAPVAMVDFQAVLNHRGVAWMLGSDVYPMAQIGAARAAWDSRDKQASAENYIKFLALWPQADQGDPLVKEALARTKVRSR